MSTWKHATVVHTDRLKFDGTYKAYDAADVEITGDAEVLFKLRFSGRDEYLNDFGGDLSPLGCQRFADASNYDNLRVSGDSNVHRIKLKISGDWISFYPA